jgi:hypothetical protein
MGKAVGGQTEAPAVTTPGSGGREPIGRYLAQQRKLRGLTLDELSVQTRIPRRSLERLEAGAFDRAPDGFARGFVRTVAEAIGLDPDETVARMLEEPTGATRRASRTGAGLFALAGVALVIALGVGLSRLDLAADGSATPASGLPTRRDFVRELAEARGLSPAYGVAGATLPPEPPAPEPPPPAAAEPIAEAAASSAPVLATPQAPRAAPSRPSPVASAPRAANAAPPEPAGASPPATAARPLEPPRASEESLGASAPIAAPSAPAVVASEAAAAAPAPESAPEASGPATATQLAPVPAPELPVGPETAAPAAAASERAEDPN